MSGHELFKNIKDNYPDIEVIVISEQEEIDTAMKLGTNYPHGPLAWGDVIGLDAVLGVMTGLFNAQSAESTVNRNYFSGKEPGTSKLGEKVFSDGVTLRSDIGNPILRQNPIGGDNLPLGDVTWVEKGVLKNLAYNAAYARRQKKPVTPASINNSLVMEGTKMSVEEMIKSTRRGLLVTFFWYIRSVDQELLLNTGMTRDGLFLIENGEIAGPVQNFRWNMSPIVGYNNLTAVGKPVPMDTGESYGGNSALVPPVRIEDFLMSSVSPAV